MAEGQPHHVPEAHVSQDTENAGGEIKGRGILDFLGKKEEEKPQEAVVAAELEKVHVSEAHEKKEEEEKKEEKPSLIEKLHRSHSSSSSSSSDEEEGEGGEKKKKKKGLKEKIKEKISGDKEEEKKAEKTEDTTVPVPAPAPVVKFEDTHEESLEEKKGFLDKIKEKLPGAHPKKTDEGTAPVVAECVADPQRQEGEAAKEKKGLLEKIKEKLPGYHKTGEEKDESAAQ